MLVLLASLLTLAVPAPPSQTLVVTTPSWQATRGSATLLEDGRVVLGPLPVAIGHHGLGWGRGEHPTPRGAGAARLKREGDGRSPAGVFRLGAIWTRERARDHYCVDDPGAAEYARIVHLAPGERPRWRTAEDLTAYRVAVVVEHNAARVKGAGSCIFLHDGTRPTVGCTAFARGDLDALLERLAPGARFVQLPAGVYRERAADWDLPALPGR